MQDAGFQIREFIGGLSLFLYGLYLFQISIKKIGGKFLRKILEKRTATPLKGILAGTATTAILQSSSVITILILGFVGANMLNFENAIGTIIGANIGSTVSAWMIAIFGFELSLTTFALPLLGISGILSLVFAKKRKLHYTATFFFGFALLLFGIGFMRTSFDLLQNGFNITNYINLPLILYLVLGLVITSILQSSAVNNIMVFTGFSSGIISFEAGMAMIIGANIGTTITAVLGAIGGNVGQKRVAAIHVLYNIFVATIMFPIILPMKQALLFMGLKENVIGLAAYHSLFNIIGAIIFFPLIKYSQILIKKIIRENNQDKSLTIEHIKDSDIETALGALKQDLANLTNQVMYFELGMFNIKPQKILQETPQKELARNEKPLREKKYYKDLLSNIEHIQNQIGNFCIKIETEDPKEENVEKVLSYNKASINLYQSAKQIFDIKEQIDQLFDDDHQMTKDVFSEIQNTIMDFFIQLYQKKEVPQGVEQLLVLAEDIRKQRHILEEKMQSKLFKNTIFGLFRKNSELTINNILTTNLYLYNAKKLILQAVKEQILDKGERERLEREIAKFEKVTNK